MLDVTARLNELALLEDGWLEGAGVAPPRAGLEWFDSAFDRHFPCDLPLPHLYPTPEGGIQAEWAIGGNEISLEVDLAARTAELHVLDMGSGWDDTVTLDLNRDAGWDELISRLRGLAGAET